MPTLDWLNRDAAFRSALAVPTRVLRPHAAGGRFGGTTNIVAASSWRTLQIDHVEPLVPEQRTAVADQPRL